MEGNNGNNLVKIGHKPFQLYMDYLNYLKIVEVITDNSNSQSTI